MTEQKRFSDKSLESIRNAVSQSTPQNTVKTRNSIWQQFHQFCNERKYQLLSNTPVQEIAEILEDWAYNMRKKNGEDYKEMCIKSIWNTTAKLVQEKYFSEYQVKINPFSDILFANARRARDAKRKNLQERADKRKQSSQALSAKEISAMASIWNEEEPDGLQRKCFHVFAFELAWRGNEAVNCKIHFFKEEVNNEGNWTGRVEYNPIFSKTAQGGSQNLTNSKWLIQNKENENLCPVRLLKKLLSKRGTNIKTDRLFLTVNQNWKCGKWYKDMPVGINMLSKWTRQSAEKIGLSTKKAKITNHSHRASAVSTLAKSGIGEEQLIKITGHAHSQSIKPYLQLDTEHHYNLVNNLRTGTQTEAGPSSTIAVSSKNNENNKHQTIYNNCTFHIINN